MAKTGKATRETTVQDAIQQKKPFHSVSQEGVIALLLTTEALRGVYHDLVSSRGDLTSQQYNVLRILRGAGGEGLPTLSIAERMVERTPGISRLIDRLEKKGLVERHRSVEDRRQVLCRITDRGRSLLRGLDRPIDKLDEEALAALSKSEIRQLIRLLDRVRNNLA